MNGTKDRPPVTPIEAEGGLASMRRPFAGASFKVGNGFCCCCIWVLQASLNQSSFKLSGQNSAHTWSGSTLEPSSTQLQCIVGKISKTFGRISLRERAQLLTCAVLDGFSALLNERLNATASLMLMRESLS